MIGSDDAVDDVIVLVFEFVDSMDFVEIMEKLEFVEIVVALLAFVSIIDAISVETPWVEKFTAFFCCWGESMSRLDRLTNHCTRNLAIC